MKSLIGFLGIALLCVLCLIKLFLNPVSKDTGPGYSKYSERYVPATIDRAFLPSRDYRIRSSC